MTLEHSHKVAREQEPPWSEVRQRLLPPEAGINGQYLHHWVRDGGNLTHRDYYTTGTLFLHSKALTIAHETARRHGDEEALRHMQNHLAQTKIVMESAVAEDDLTTVEVQEQAGFDFDGQIEIDEENGVVKNVAILGLQSPTHDRRYTEEALRDAVDAFEGLAFYGDRNDKHRDKDARASPFDLIGRAVNVRFVNEQKMLRADIDVLTAQQDFFVPMAQNMPQVCGISPKMAVAVKYEGETEVGHKIVKPYQLDLVSHPSTVKGLAESAKQNEETEQMEGTITIQKLKDEHPDLVSRIVSEAQEDFEDEERVKELSEQVSDLKETISEKDQKIDELETKLAVREQKDTAVELVSESDIPDQHVTETFMDQLIACEGEEDMKELIEDREKLVAEAAGSEPTSYEREVTESEDRTGGDGPDPAEMEDEELAKGLKS